MNEKFYSHSTAIIENPNNIGEGTKIWVNVQIRENVKIGSNCILSKDVYIDQNVTIGNNCKIQNGVSIYQGVSIMDDVFVGPEVSFINDKVPRAFNTQWKTSPTLIKKGASIGANSTILCGINIGEYAMVAAGSIVTKNVEPFTLVLGSPAKYLYKIDKMGNKVE